MNGHAKAPVLDVLPVRGLFVWGYCAALFGSAGLGEAALAQVPEQATESGPLQCRQQKGGQVGHLKRIGDDLEPQQRQVNQEQDGGCPHEERDGALGA